MTNILDTSAIIKAMKSPALAEKIGAITGDSPLSTTSICKQELLMVRTDKEQFVVKHILDTMNIFEHTSLAADLGAEIWHDLRNKGTLIHEFDILIAAICKANNAHLITFDKDFVKIKDLQVTVL